MPPEMSNREAIEMMNRAIHDIQDLRARIATLEPKAHAYDNISSILGLLPQPSRGMAEDLVWRMKKRIEELQTNPAP